MSYKFKQTQPNPYFPQIMDVEPEEVLEATPQVLLIDVREIHEFTGELRHVPQSKLIVLSTLADKLNTLPKDKTIVFICRSGGRSAQAAAFCKAHGFHETYNMRGGMLEWNELQLPVEK